MQPKDISFNAYDMVNYDVVFL